MDNNVTSAEMPAEMQINIDNGAVYGCPDGECSAWRFNDGNLVFSDDRQPTPQDRIVWTHAELWELMKESGREYTIARWREKKW
jgi:hypothetical protein